MAGVKGGSMVAFRAEDESIERSRSLTARASARSAALRLAAGYAVVALLWILFSDHVLGSLGLSAQTITLISEAKGTLFVAVTATVLFVFAYRIFRTLQTEDERIRSAYVDTLSAVTGGKLVLLSESEIDAALGMPLDDPHRITDGKGLTEARAQIRHAVGERVAPEDLTMAVLSPSGEALNNALKHGGAAEYQVFARNSTLQIKIADNGPGIDFRTLPRATLVAGFSTTDTLGLGFTMMLQLSDRILLSTRPGRTVVVLETSGVSRV